MVIKRKYMMNIIFLVVVIGGIIYFQKSIKNSENKRLKASNYAIGTFEGFGYASRAGGINYKYSYYNEVEGRKKNKTDQSRMPKIEQQKILIEGDQFLVLYNEDGSSIYFDYPIKDSIEFKRYVHEFEEMRKQKK